MRAFEGQQYFPDTVGVGDMPHGLAFHQLNQPRANHHRIGHAANGAGRFGIAYAKAHAHGHMHMAANARHGRLHLRDIQAGRARHALERHVIHIAAGQARHLRHALVRAGGRKQEDEVQPRAFERGGKVGAFLGRVIDDEQAIHARRRCIANERARAAPLVIALHGVGITHQHHGRLAVLLAEGFHHLQHLRQPRAARQRLLARALNHGAIGIGV